VVVSAWVKIGAAFGVATLAAAFVPRAGDGGGDVPGLATLLPTGALVGLLTTAALFVVLRRDLGLPTAVTLFAVGYNALVVLVKFVLGPRSVYEASVQGKLNGYVAPSDTSAAVAIACGLFLLYAAVLFVVYRISRRVRMGPRPARVRRAVVVAVVAAAVVIATGGVPLLMLLGGLEYASYVFTTGVSGLVTLALGIAIWLAAKTFLGTAERAQVVGDAALLVSVFWIGLAFLALYHALWVVYVLALTTIWPLKVITPK